MVRQGTATGRYLFSQHGTPSERGGFQGMHILRDNAGCRIYKPTWNGTRTVVRILPVRDPEDNTRWDPYRISNEPRGFGDWIRKYDMGMNIGNPGITYILKDPRDRSIDDQQNPLAMLKRSLDSSMRAGQALGNWSQLLVSQAGKGAALTAPKDGYLIQCILMEHKSKTQSPPLGCRAEDPVVVMLLPQSAGEALLNKLEERDATTGEYRYKDIIDLDGGMYVQFHQFGTQAPAGSAAVQRMDAGGGGSRGGNNPQENRYEVEILDNYHAIPAAIPYLADILARKAKAWDDIVYVMPIEEQVRKLSRCGIPATAIVYALYETYSDFIPDDVLEQARAQQTQTHVPFAIPGLPANPMNGGPMAAANPMVAPSMAAPLYRIPSAPATPQPNNPMTMPQVPTPVMAPVGNVTAPPPGPPTMMSAPQPVAAETAPPPQPLHADPARAAQTMDALARARARAAGGA